jgi:DNA-binding response OmpR family regulator
MSNSAVPVPGLEIRGREALARDTEVNRVIIDYMLPDLDGFATLRELRQEARYATLPAIMLTARGQTNLREAAAEVGVDVFLTKPFSPIELTQHVRQLLGAPPV